MDNVGIYSVGRDMMYQIWQYSKTECFAGRPYPRNTRDNQLSPSVMTLRIPVMCWAHGFTLREGFLRATRENSFDLQFVLSLHTLSHAQLLQRNPTYNTWYIRLNIITVKFGIELKPTQISCKSQLYISHVNCQSQLMNLLLFQQYKKTSM